MAPARARTNKNAQAFLARGCGVYPDRTHRANAILGTSAAIAPPSHLRETHKRERQRRRLGRPYGVPGCGSRRGYEERSRHRGSRVKAQRYNEERVTGVGGVRADRWCRLCRTKNPCLAIRRPPKVALGTRASRVDPVGARALSRTKIGVVCRPPIGCLPLAAESVQEYTESALFLQTTPKAWMPVALMTGPKLRFDP